MTPPPQSLSTGRLRRGVLVALAVAAPIALIRFLALGPSLGVGRAPGAAWHAPRLELLAGQPPAVLAHLAAALGALAVGVVLMTGIKGDGVHRRLGWAWVALMAMTAASSLLIRQVNHGDFSWLHLFAGWTAVALPGGVWAARHHKVTAHARTMTGLFVGALLIAGSFNFAPGRLMWRIFFG